jgi:hypothetical protein
VTTLQSSLLCTSLNFSHRNLAPHFSSSFRSQGKPFLLLFTLHSFLIGHYTGNVNAAVELITGITKQQMPASQKKEKTALAVAGGGVATASKSEPLSHSFSFLKCEYLDYYLGKNACFCGHPHVLLSMVLLPCQIVFAALWIHARAHKRVLPLPRLMQLKFPPLHLQRYLRGFVTLAADKLGNPMASKYYIHRVNLLIFMRVMSGFFWKSEVRMLVVMMLALCSPALAIVEFYLY